MNGTARFRPRTLGLDRFSGLYLWAIFIIVFGIWTPGLFLSIATVHSVASAQAVTGMLAIAVLVPLVGGSFDLSVGSTVTLSAVLSASLQSVYQWPMVPSIIVAIAACVAIGCINGFLVVRLHIDSFIATLGMGTVITAVQEIITHDSQPPPPSSTTWNNLALTNVGGFQIVVVFLLVLAVIVWWVLDHTPAGRYLYAIGGNREAARLAGVQVGKWTWISLIASSSICSIAGILYSAQNGPSLTFGQELLLPAFAAAFLGQTQLFPGRLNLWGTFISVFVLATGVKGLQYVSGVQWPSDMFNGVAVLVAVGFAVQRSRAKSSDSASAAGRKKSGRGGPEPSVANDALPSADVPHTERVVETPGQVLTEEVRP